MHEVFQILFLENQGNKSGEILMISILVLIFDLLRPKFHLSCNLFYYSETDDFTYINV
jgi:hypothetical protein